MIEIPRDFLYYHVLVVMLLLLLLMVPLPFCSKQPYTHVSIIWLCYSFLHEKYIVFNLINYITLNISYKVLIGLSCFECVPQCDMYNIIVHHVIKHYLPLPVLYYAYCKHVSSTANIDIMRICYANIGMSLLWSYICVGSLNLSEIYGYVQFKIWMLIWMVNACLFYGVGYLLSHLSICFE
jgi:hypothetical protein